MRNFDRTNGVLHKIAPEEQATCNIEWFLSRQQYTRTPTRSGLRTQGGERSAALTTSQTLLRRSRASLMLHSRQSQRRQSNLNTQAGSSTSPSEFGFLTQTRLGGRLDSAQKSINYKPAAKQTTQAVLTTTQLNRKLHSNLQEYAMIFIEQRRSKDEKIATRLKICISQLRQSQQFQTLAIKFWMIIINLQYDDVKRLSMSFSDRQLAIHYEHLYMNDVEIIHTSLPVDFIVYERVVPLFLQALGCLGDSDFKAAQIPVSHQVQNRIIKRKQKQHLLKGLIHFDKFIVDLALMLGQNLLVINENAVCFIYRKVYQAMTHRFPEDMNFIECQQIVSPFGIDTILQAQRNRGVTPSQPLIFPSSVQSGSDKRTDSVSGGGGIKIIASNETSPPLELQGMIEQKRRLPRRSFNLGRESQPLIAKNAPTSGQSQGQESSKKRRYTSFTNLNVGSAIRMNSGAAEDRLDVLPAPPHACRHEDKTENDSRSELSAQRRQRIKVGLPNPIENALSEDPKGCNEHNETQEQNSTSDLAEEKFDENDEKSSEEKYRESQQSNEEQQQSFQKQLIDTELFDFDKLTAARQNFVDDLNAKRTMLQMRAEHLLPFETLFTRKSCLDYLEQAKEFLADEETRVAKTPAGFNRPKKNHSRIVFHKHNKRQFSPRLLCSPDQEEIKPVEKQKPEQRGLFVRTATRLLDQAANEPIDQHQELVNHTGHGTIHEAQQNREQTNCTAKLSARHVLNAQDDDRKHQEDNHITKRSHTGEEKSPKFAVPEPLAQYHFKKQSSGLSLESGYSSAVSSKPPVVHVRKYGSPQDLANSEGGGNFQRIRLMAPQPGSDDSQATKTLRKNGTQDGFFDQSPSNGLHIANSNSGSKNNSPSAAAATGRLHMMTRRLLQEKVLEQVIKARLIENARLRNIGAKNTMPNEEYLQLERILNKLDLEELIRQQSRAQQFQLVDPADSQIKIYDVSISQVQRSLEEQAQTHVTSSQEDSQFQVQEPVTKPKFNEDFPPDVLMKPEQKQQAPTLNCGAKESVVATLVTAQSSPTPASRPQQQSGHMEATMSSINRSRMDPSVRFAQQNSVRKRVFYNGNSLTQKKLSPIYNNRLQQSNIITTPILVQAVDKNDIEEMEATGMHPHPNSKFVRMVNVSSGRDKTPIVAGAGAIIASTKAPGHVPTTRVVPLSTNSQSTNVMRFDNNRKSYVTAQLSGKEEVSDIEMPEVGRPEAISGTPRGANSTSMILTKNEISGVDNDDEMASKVMEGQTVAGLSRSNTLGRHVKQMRNSTQPGKSTSHSSQENFAMIRRFQNLSGVSKKDASFAGWKKSQSGTNFSEHQIMLNVSQQQQFEQFHQKQLEMQKQRCQRRSSQISVQVDKAKRQLEEQQESQYVREQNRVRQLQGIMTKQAEMFPFAKRKNELLVQPQSTKNAATAESKKIQAGLFALRRANKNRRTQLHRATASRKEQIVNSKIPGVDYSHHHSSKSPVRVFETGNTDVMFAVPDYLLQKLLTQPNKTGGGVIDGQGAEQEVYTVEAPSALNSLVQTAPTPQETPMRPEGATQVMSSEQLLKLDYLNNARIISNSQNTGLTASQSHPFIPPKAALFKKQQKQQRIVKKKVSEVSTQLLDQQSQISPLFRRGTGQINGTGIASNFSLGLQKIDDTEQQPNVEAKDRRKTEYLTTKNTRIIGFIEQSSKKLTEAGVLSGKIQEEQDDQDEMEELLVVIDDNSPKLTTSKSSKSSPMRVNAIKSTLKIAAAQEQ